VADAAPPGSDRVDALFARIKADRAAAAVLPRTTPPDAPAPPAGSPPASVVAQTPSSANGEIADIADEAARARRDELLEPIQDALARQLKRVLQDEQNEVLDGLRRRRRKRGDSPLPPLDEHVGRFREAAESLLDDAVRAGVRFADPNASEAHAGASARRDVATALAAAIVEPLRHRLERSLSDGGGEGDDDRDSAEVSELVSGVYRQWRAQELEPLATHSAADAFGRGAYAAYPGGARLRWVVDDDGPCPDCDDNALAGAVAKGEAYPTGQAHPPAHPGCRCLLVPAG
jgi:hypothetical protein